MYPWRNHSRETIRLPKPDKKIIYLDQFLVSDFALIKEGSTKNIPNRTFETYRRIERAFLLQLIVCPTSDSHDDESMASLRYHDINDASKMFSGDTRFFSYDDIEILQIKKTFEDWIEEKNTNTKEHKVNVLAGDVNSWIEKFRVTTKRDWGSKIIEDYKRQRNKHRDALINAFDNFKQFKKDPFAHCYEEEINSFSGVILKGFANYLRNVQTQNIEALLNTPVHFEIISALYHMAMDKYGDEKLSRDTVIKFLNSKETHTIEFLQISCVLFSAIARKLWNGSHKIINTGTIEDIRIISHITPYCDAIFIDKSMHALLTENPAKDKISSTTKIFSWSNINDFFAYLSSLEEEANPEVLSTAKSLYSVPDVP